MTQNKVPILIINRLVVSSQGKIVYSEGFHEGVNIIRGRNGSGKSTIADFIFYALGGDYNKWLPEASLCDYVLIEVNINETIYTFKRKITPNIRQSMYIYWGTIDDAMKENIKGWNEYPFQRSTTKESFSQAVFRMLDFPEVRGDFDSNITLHQIFRLVYVDQISSVDSLLRDENFDSSLTRKTIGDLLLGVYDDSLYKDELDLKNSKRKLESTDGQINNIIDLLCDVGQELNLDEIEKQINDSEDQLNKINKTISGYIAEKVYKEKDVIGESFVEKRKEYIDLKRALNVLTNEIKDLEFEVEDSILFIHTLEKRIDAIDESFITRECLGELPITFCPSCLSHINIEVPENACSLCKTEFTSDIKSLRIEKIKQELFLQIKESKELLLNRKDELLSKKNDLPSLQERIYIAKSDLENELNNVRTKRDKDYDDLLIKKGYLESNIMYLHKQAKSLAMLEDLKTKKNELHAEVNKLELSIKSKIFKQKERQQITHNTIEKWVKKILKSDLPRENEFANASTVETDFSRNTFWVNKRNQFSASSIVLLKNAFHYATLFSSLELSYFRYPRFFLCDNMEDKGMEEGRSQNFQCMIAKFAQEINKKHQIIFTTSMIAPSLDNETFCVGQKYTEENKSLKMEGVT